MGNLELMERAFAIAGSGSVTDVSQLCDALLHQGASRADVEQFKGRALHKQLSSKIASAKSQNSPMVHPGKPVQGDAVCVRGS